MAKQDLKRWKLLYIEQGCLHSWGCQCVPCMSRLHGTITLFLPTVSPAGLPSSLFFFLLFAATAKTLAHRGCPGHTVEKAPPPEALLPVFTWAAVKRSHEPRPSPAFTCCPGTCCHPCSLSRCPAGIPSLLGVGGESRGDSGFPSGA